jgi:hypothetical protein
MTHIGAPYACSACGLSVERHGEEDGRQRKDTRKIAVEGWSTSQRSGIPETDAHERRAPELAIVRVTRDADVRERHRKRTELLEHAPAAEEPAHVRRDLRARERISRSARPL